MSRSQGVQDPFLKAVCQEQVPVSIYLINGVKLKGQVHSYDQFVVILKEAVNQMIYKHAISTIVPASMIEFGNLAEGEVSH